MRYSFLSAALFAATALAAPMPKVHHEYKVVTVVEVVTVIGHRPTPRPASGEYVQYKPRPYEAPKPTPAAVYHPAPVYKPAPPPASTPAAYAAPPSSYNDGSPMSGDKSILSIVNKYRSKYGLNTLEWDEQLVGNSQKTTNYNHGSSENHELNPGSHAQCLTPGFNKAAPGMDLHGATPFEMAYLSWMCEKSSDPELSPAQNGGVNLCSMVTGGNSIMHMVLNELGHYKILTSKSYSKIGCAFTSNPNSHEDMWTGLWGCDLA